METPFYEIVTMCPYGMAPELQSYLNNTVEVDDKIIQMKGLIANVILEPYYESELPFACTLLGWASLDKEQELQMMVQSIMESLKCYRSEELVSVEGFGHSLDKGVIQIHGVYPLLDLNVSVKTNTPCYSNQSSADYQVFHPGIEPEVHRTRALAYQAEQGCLNQYSVIVRANI